MKVTDKLEIVKGKPARNRIVLPPMDTLMGNDGYSNDFHIQHYGSKAYGGYGTIIVESTAISSEGKIRPMDIGLWEKEQIEGHKRITNIAHMGGSIIGVQLNHAGAKAEMEDEDRIGPTMYFDYLPMNRFSLITEKQIKEVEDKFVQSAKWAKEAGYDFIEIHGAHGYLLSCLIHPKLNDVIKSDDITKRAEVIINILKRINDEVKITAGIRFSTSDHEKDGMRPIDFKPLIEKIDKYISYYNVSSGEMLNRTNVGEAMKEAGTTIFRIPLVKEFRKLTKKPLVMAGNIMDRKTVDEALAAGTDGVAIGREGIFNPSLVINNILKHDEISDQYHFNKNIWFQPKDYAKLKESIKK